MLSFASVNRNTFVSGVPLYWDGGTPELEGEPVSFAQIDGSNVLVYVFLQQSRNQPPVYPSIASGQTIGVGGPAAGGGVTVDLSSRIPLISIRLAPSADNNIIGELGERDIINRMQLKLKELGVSTSRYRNYGSSECIIE